jgi:hypothetical protein
MQRETMTDNMILALVGAAGSKQRVEGDLSHFHWHIPMQSRYNDPL